MGPDENKVMGAESPPEDAPSTKPRGDAAPPADAGSGTSGNLVKTRWPIGEFKVEDIPVINMDGVRLSDTELSTAQRVADLCEVKLDVVKDGS
jgi:hypothetical protein